VNYALVEPHRQTILPQQSLRRAEVLADQWLDPVEPKNGSHQKSGVGAPG